MAASVNKNALRVFSPGKAGSHAGRHRAVFCPAYQAHRDPGLRRTLGGVQLYEILPHQHAAFQCDDLRDRELRQTVFSPGLVDQKLPHIVVNAVCDHAANGRIRAERKRHQQGDRAHGNAVQPELTLQVFRRPADPTGHVPTFPNAEGELSALTLPVAALVDHPDRKASFPIVIHDPAEIIFPGRSVSVREKDGLISAAPEHSTVKVLAAVISQPNILPGHSADRGDPFLQHFAIGLPARSAKLFRIGQIRHRPAAQVHKKEHPNGEKQKEKQNAKS